MAPRRRQFGQKPRAGTAFAIDATGNRTNVTTTVDGNLVRLQVDAAWLEQAQYPVTVDPLVTPTNIDFGSLRESMDICRDDTANQRMYVSSAPPRPRTRTSTPT